MQKQEPGQMVRISANVLKKEEKIEPKATEEKDEYQVRKGRT